MQCRKVVRQQSSRGTVGCRSQLRQHPAEVGFRVDTYQPTRPDHTIQHRRSPARVGVTYEQIIPQTYFARAEAALDGVLIDQDVTALDPCVSGQISPAMVGVDD